MALVQSINSVHQFREAFRLAGRSDQFSSEGLEVLFDYLDNLSEDTFLSCLCGSEQNKARTTAGNDFF